jgi:HicB-like protein involved in pilus formation
MKTLTSAYALRLPASIKAEAEKLAAEEGTSLNQFVATAVAEKVSALRTVRFFAERKGRADWEAFDRIMGREGGEPPREGDEIPDVYGTKSRSSG